MLSSRMLMCTQANVNDRLCELLQGLLAASCGQCAHAPLVKTSTTCLPLHAQSEHQPHPPTRAHSGAVHCFGYHQPAPPAARGGRQRLVTLRSGARRGNQGPSFGPAALQPGFAGECLSAPGCHNTGELDSRRNTAKLTVTECLQPSIARCCTYLCLCVRMCSHFLDVSCLPSAFN